jgi:hypothetical protein
LLLPLIPGIRIQQCQSGICQTAAKKKVRMTEKKIAQLVPKPTVTNLIVPNLDATWFDCTKFLELFPNHFNS